MHEVVTRPAAGRGTRGPSVGGPVEPVGPLFVQRAGIGLTDARSLLEQRRRHSLVPEPLRTAHLIAGGVTRGESTGRA